MSAPTNYRVSQLVPFKRRLVTAGDRVKGERDGVNDNPATSLASEIRTYGNGLAVKFDRSYFAKNGTYTVVALDADSGVVLRFREGEKRYEDARRSIERSLKV